MSQKEQPATCTIRVRLTKEILGAMDALRQMNGEVEVRPSQLYQAMMQRGAKALLADVEFGANLKLSNSDEN